MKIVSLLIFTLSLDTALACSCVIPSIINNFKAADVVFKGRVVEVKEIKTKKKITAGQTVDYQRYEFKFEISNRHKGLKTKEPVTIITTGDDSNCGNKFNIGKNYLVYAYKEESILSFPLLNKKTGEYLNTNICTRTKQAKFWTFLESLVLDII